MKKAIIVWGLLAVVVVSYAQGPPPSAYIEITVLAETGRFPIFAPFPFDGYGCYHPITGPESYLHHWFNYTMHVWEPPAGRDYEIYAHQSLALDLPNQWEEESSHAVVENAQGFPIITYVQVVFPRKP